MRAPLSWFSFIVCGSIFFWSWTEFGITPFLGLYALCALVNVPFMIKSLREKKPVNHTDDFCCERCALYKNHRATLGFVGRAPKDKPPTH